MLFRSFQITWTLRDTVRSPIAGSGANDESGLTDLSRENVMKQAANLTNLELPMLLPGIKINTSPTDYFPTEQGQMMRFDGKQWVRFGEILGK